MKILVLNGSPRQNGMVASLLKTVTEPLSAEHIVEWIDVCRLNMKYCTACMVCREKEIKEVLHYGGYKTVGSITKPGTKKSKEISSSLAAKARLLGKKLTQR